VPFESHPSDDEEKRDKNFQGFGIDAWTCFGGSWTSRFAGGLKIRAP
jgi:hypothetical protein